jgi:bacillolysin
MRKALTFLMVWGCAAGVPAAQATRLALVEGADLRAGDERVGQLVRAGALRLDRAEPDTVLPGRRHERFVQLHGGVPVFGGEVVRQSDAAGTVSVFGTYYEGLEGVPTLPRLGPEQAAARVAALAGQSPLAGAELVVFPRRDGGGYSLAWHLRAFEGARRYAYFIDALDGTLVHRLADLPTQARAPAAVGLGHGVLNDAKKMSAESQGGSFRAVDNLRPATILSYDLKGDLARVDAFLHGVGRITAADLAVDADNDWTDGAVVDAHTYIGWTYDYYFKRFGRRGLDGRDGPLFAILHPASRATARSQPDDIIDTYYANAFYAGAGLMVFGEGLPPELRLDTGQQVDYVAGSLDVVAHELTHGVTDSTSRLIYEGESGALNEAFSDIMGTSAEFFFQEPGNGPLRAGIRSMASPTAFNDPDHYGVRFVASGPCGEQNDECGVHINSGIVNHAFYLAVEGGRNRVSGLAVQGVGAANREQMERVFYRAFTLMLPRAADFALARAATVQSARDQFGAGSAPERAVTQAWTAVGVQ